MNGLIGWKRARWHGRMLAGCLGIFILVSLSYGGRAVEPPRPQAAALGSNQAFAARAGLSLAALDPTGRKLALVNPLGRVELRDVEDNYWLATLPARAGVRATGLAFSPEGRDLAALADDGRVDIWQLATGYRHRVWGVPDGVHLLAFAPKGGLLAIAGRRGLTLRDVQTGTIRHVLPGHVGFTTLALAFSPDGQRLASLGDNGEAIVWDTASGQALATIAGLSALPDSLAFNAGGDQLAALREDGRAGWWEASTGRPGSLLADPQPARLTGFAFAGGRLAGIGDDGRVRVVDSADGGPRPVLVLADGARALALAPGGGTLAVADSGGGVQLWNTADGAAGTRFAWPEAPLALAYGPDGATLVGVGPSGRVRVQTADGAGYALAGTAPTAAATAGVVLAPAQAPAASVSTTPAAVAPAANTAAAAKTAAAPPNAPALVRRVGQGLTANVRQRVWKGVASLAISPDGGVLGIGGANGELRAESSDGVERYAMTAHHGRMITALAFSADGARMLSAGQDSEVVVWDAATGQQQAVLRGPEHAVRSVAGSSDGRIAASGEDARVLIWDRDGHLLRIFYGHRDVVNSLAFSPDGKRLASAGADTRIMLWDMDGADGAAPMILANGAGLNAVAFSPDGRLLAGAGADSRVRLWDVASGRQIRAYSGHNAAVRGLAFSPDGRFLASGGEDTRTLIWDMATGGLHQTLTGGRMVNGVAFGRDARLYAGDESGKVVEWNTRTGARRDLMSLPARPGGASNQPLFLERMLGRVLDWLIPGAAAAVPPPPHGPILVVMSGTTGFGAYYPEILRAEGFNEFDVQDISALAAADLNSHDLVLLAPMALNDAQATLLSNWVANSGGNLIAMRPDSRLAGLLGLAPTGSTLAEGYLSVDTGRAPGIGIVGQPMQFHGMADRYALNGATAVATLYTNISTATAQPAVSLRTVGSGHAAAFLYDLAASVIYTRQGNPAWAAQERDGFAPIRSDDKFYGAATGDPRPDWVDLANELPVPQADEQQRLLANLILNMNLARKPLPRFWYFPFAKPAVLIMTGDDHANGGTAGRFDQFVANSPAGCSVADWQCVRGTSYLYPNSPLTDAQARNYTAQGFEVGLHINTNCADFTPASLENFYAQQISAWTARYSSAPKPITQRHHCIAWSDWATAAKTELNHGMRLDTSYYFWPPGWVQDRPGVFTGSGLPMRFADSNGTPIDVYNATTQMTDESGQSYPATVDTLLDRALGPTGYYGAYTINAHTDAATEPQADAAVASALNRGVPIVSSVQMLNWLDARGGSSFGGLAFNNNVLSFSVAPVGAANGLTALLPIRSASGALAGLTRNGSPLAFTRQTVKGIEYALFPVANGGNYAATYAADTAPPTVTGTVPADGAGQVNPGVQVQASFSKALDPTSVSGSTFTLQGPSGTLAATVAYDAGTASALLTPTASLAYGTAYTATLKGGATDPRIKDPAGNALANNVAWSFTTAAAPSCPCSLWPANPTPANPADNDANAVELGVKFRADADGVVSGLRFYKGAGNTGPHVGTLWSASGTALATVTFGAETATGWQQANFANPVPISANTVYVASYHAPAGHYAGDTGFFAAAGVDTPPLHALRDGASGGNGVYAYGPGGFPTNTFQSANYWVDAIFTPGAAPPPPPNNTSLFGTATPGRADAGDANNPVNLGVRFRSDSAGKILGIRFYKSAANTGTHTGHLWSADGTLLASATFAGETASGWQQANFATPVAIAANTLYVASYHTHAGHYSSDANYFTRATDAPPLHAPASGASGFNGVFAYNAQQQFPNQGFNASNYWVDVVFGS